MVVRSLELAQPTELPLAKPLLATLLEKLGNEDATTLRQITRLLHPPIDTCRIEAVLSAISVSLNQFRDTTPHAPEILIDICNRVTQLNIAIDALLASEVSQARLERPLLGSLRQHSAWALFLALNDGTPSTDLIHVVGAELWLSMVRQAPFKDGFATLVRQHVENPVPSDESRQRIEKLCTSTRKIVERHLGFYRGTSSSPEAAELPLDLALRHYFKRRQHFSNEKSHQGVLNHSTQTALQIAESAKDLYNRILENDPEALQIVLSVLWGLDIYLVKRIPLGSSAPTEWRILFDDATGILKLDIELVAPGAAKARTGTAPNALEESSWILATPLPQFIFKIILGLLAENPNASTLGDLLPVVNISPRSTTLDYQTTVGIAPTAARLRNSLAPYALTLGVDRTTAALVSHDFRIIPRSQLYYSITQRDEIWLAATTLYQDLGWGEPVPLEAGLAVGSAIVPKLETIKAWHAAMVDRLNDPAMDGIATKQELYQAHTLYAQYIASLVAFLTAARECRVLPFSAATLCEKTTSLPLIDKRVGNPPSRVPGCPTLRQVLMNWLDHCKALDQRLEALGVGPDTPVRRHVKAIQNGDDVALLFVLGQRARPRAIGTSDLVTLWPKDLGLEPNFSRGFWQYHLPREGLSSRATDAFLRHYTRGTQIWSSTSDVIPATWLKHISAAIERVVGHLDITPASSLLPLDSRETQK